METSNSLVVKCAGGAAAQTLALMDALYVSKRTGRHFTFEYYPSGTGTYWPFEIRDLLEPREIPLEFKVSRGHSGTPHDLLIGKIDPTHPVNSKKIALEHVYTGIRKLGLDGFLLSLRREIPIQTSKRQLNKVNSKTKIISGGYLPIQDLSVFEELQKRFALASFPSPFVEVDHKESKFEVVIHYRIGDKRAKFTNPEVVGDDGVLDPWTFAREIINLDLSKARILVLSDEPEIAQELLKAVGVFAEVCTQRNNIWTDLQLMSRAKVFLGSWSQVSQLAAAFVLHNGGKAYLPSEKSGKNALNWTLDGLITYKPKFLAEDHPIYFKKNA